jgi:hypothetical protein
MDQLNVRVAALTLIVAMAMQVLRDRPALMFEWKTRALKAAAEEGDLAIMLDVCGQMGADDES